MSDKGRACYTNHPLLRNLGVIAFILPTPPSAMFFRYTGCYD